MKRIVITAVVAPPVVMLACRREETPPVWANFSDEGVAAAARIGRSLQDSVVASKLRQCWGQLQGEGVIAMDLNYRKADNTWTLRRSTRTPAPPYPKRACAAGFPDRAA